MQSSEAAVKKDIINHPFRKIEIVFEAGKTTLTPQDELLLNAYIRLHDLHLDIKNKAEELYRESLTIKQTITLLEKELEKVKATFNTGLEIADKLSAPGYNPEEVSLDKLRAARQETMSQISAYHPKILALYETVQVLSKKMTEETNSDEEKLEALYDEMSTLSLDHINNWENNSINAVVFDQQFDQFKAYASVIETHRDDLLQACDKQVTNYTLLNNQTTTLYNVWDEFLKRCDLLIAMADLHSGTMTFNVN
jgi:hypothetical protein